jgi:hypothetical protein
MGASEVHRTTALIAPTAVFISDRENTGAAGNPDLSAPKGPVFTRLRECAAFGQIAFGFLEKIADGRVAIALPYEWIGDRYGGLAATI